MGFVMGSIVNQDPSQFGQAAASAGQNPGTDTSPRAIYLNTTSLPEGFAQERRLPLRSFTFCELTTD